MFAVYYRKGEKNRWQYHEVIEDKEQAIKRAQRVANEHGQAMIRVVVGKPPKHVTSAYSGGMRFTQSANDSSLEKQLKQFGDSQKAVEQAGKTIRHGGEAGGLAGFLKAIMGQQDDEHEHTLVKTIPMQPNWKKIHDEMHQAHDQSRHFAQKALHLKKKFWATVEEDLNDYRDMRVNDENEIEIYE